MTIEYLADHPETLDTLVQWLHQEWGHVRGGETLDQRRKRFAGSLNRDRIPLTVVALEAGELLGSASLDRSRHEDADGVDAMARKRVCGRTMPAPWHWREVGETHHG